jgi:alkaline phosphatase
MLKRLAALTLVFVLLVTGLGFMTGMAYTEGASPYKGEGKVKNVIFMIPDGFSTAYATNYRWFKGDEAIWDDFLVGMVKTHAANTEVTDSAAAGTAFATGVKTNNGMISVRPDGTPLQTILEASKQAGKATGLVATSTITHATPAVFASHVASRANEADIAPQMLERVDVLLGGGKQYFLPKSEGGQQETRNLITEAKNKGYQYVETRDQLQAAKGRKLLGLFAHDAMAAELDRKHTNEPSLAEMTSKAIKTLNQNKKGFFLMVEGSQIDWAGHAHDAAWAMRDIQAFEEAVEVAVDFAKKDGKTLVVIVGDHDTGGMSVGGYGQYDAKLEVLREVSATGNYMAAQLDKDRQNVKEVVKKYTGIELTDEEAKVIQSAKQPANAINEIISQRALVGWSSSAHTGVDVQLYAFGPHANMFAGLIDNTDVPKFMAKAMKIKLKN